MFKRKIIAYGKDRDDRDGFSYTLYVNIFGTRKVKYKASFRRMFFSWTNLYQEVINPWLGGFYSDEDLKDYASKNPSKLRFVKKQDA